MKWILGVTALAVIVGLVATISVPAQTVKPDEAILKLFPQETQGIAFVDVAGLRTAPLFIDMIVPKLPQQYPAEMSQFVQATGFDPQRDIERVTAARVGQGDMLVIVQAKYDHFKVEQFVKDNSQHITTETYLGRVIYYPAEGSSEHPNAKQGGVSFIDNLIVAGTLPSVKQAIDRMAAPAPSVVQNTELMDEIRTIDAGNQVWAAGKFDLSSLDTHLSGPAAKMGELAHQLKSGKYQMRIDQDVHVKAAGTFGSADMAKATGDMLKGLLAMARLQVSQQDALAKLVDSLSIENSAEKLTLSLNASGAILKQLEASKAGQHLGVK